MGVVPDVPCWWRIQWVAANNAYNWLCTDYQCSRMGATAGCVVELSAIQIDEKWYDWCICPLAADPACETYRETGTNAQWICPPGDCTGTLKCDKPAMPMDGNLYKACDCR